MFYLIAGVLGVVLCLMLVYTIFDNRKRRRRINLSGPQTWPFVGNLLQLDFIRPDITMEEWGKKHNGLYRMRMFSTDIVVATSYDAVHEILVSKGKSFAGRGKPFRRMVITYGGKDMIIGNPTEPHWLWLRKASQKTMRQYGDNLTRIESLISQMADEFVSKVLTYNGRPVNIRDDIYNFTMKAAFVLIAGRKPDDGEPVLQLTKKFERALILSTGTTTGLEMDYFPWLRFVGHPLYKRLLETCRLRDQLWGMLWSEIQDRYASAKGSGGDEEGNEFNDLLTISAQMLDDQSSQYQPLVDEENIRGMFINVLGGSISTTTASAYSLLNILLHHPKVYQRLQQEVDTVIGFDRKPAVNDRDVMPFTSAVILELLRFTSMVPAFPHASIEDTTILGTAIPNGTPVIPLFSAVHHDEAFWGDPWVFRPDRFLAQDGNLVAADHPNRKHVLAFGAGPRVCVGEVFAMKRLFIFTTSVIQAFELQVGDVTVSCDPRLFAKGNVLFPPDYVIKLLPRKRIY